MPSPLPPAMASFIWKRERLCLPIPNYIRIYAHQEKVVIHFEGKLHTLMVTRTWTGSSGVGQDAACKIIRPSVVCKIINA